MTANLPNFRDKKKGSHGTGRKGEKDNGVDGRKGKFRKYHFLSYGST